MRKFSGKTVGTAGTDGSKNSVHSSPIRHHYQPKNTVYSAQPAQVPYFRSLFAQYFSPLKVVASPLSEHYFYPVSTAPTNNCNQINLKER